MYLLVKTHINQAILNYLCSYACPSILTTQLTANMVSNNDGDDNDGDDNDGVDNDGDNYDDYNSPNNNADANSDLHIVTQDCDLPPTQPAPSNPSTPPTQPVQPNISTPPTLDVNNFIPPEHLGIITSAMAALGINTPRPFQLEAIHSLLFTDDRFLYLARKTGEGKYAVPQTVALLQRGIVLILVPLIGLGSDQVSKAENEENRIEAYHIDEHRYDDLTLLRNRLDGMTIDDVENTTILLFCSPQSMQKSSRWYPMLKQLKNNGFISFVCIDEAHCVAINGRSFRPEFNDAMDFISSVLKSNEHIPMLAMSATFKECDQDVISSKLDIVADKVMWGDMERRSIFLSVVVSGNTTASIKG